MCTDTNYTNELHMVKRTNRIIEALDMGASVIDANYFQVELIRFGNTRPGCEPMFTIRPTEHLEVKVAVQKKAYQRSTAGMESEYKKLCKVLKNATNQTDKDETTIKLNILQTEWDKVTRPHHKKKKKKVRPHIAIEPQTPKKKCWSCNSRKRKGCKRCR
jgi:hypothetical protein